MAPFERTNILGTVHDADSSEALRLSHFPDGHPYPCTYSENLYVLVMPEASILDVLAGAVLSISQYLKKRQSCGDNRTRHEYDPNQHFRRSG